jgi:hypothetical protein
MKNLLFYTFYRQIEEIYYSSLFFNNSDFLKSSFDVILHCNNPSISYTEIKNVAKFNTKTDIIITSKNIGYSYGGIEATSDSFELFKQFKTVIQLHPDCYIVDDACLQNTIQENFDIAVAPFMHVGRLAYTTDFFITKIKTNFLESCHDNWKKKPNDIPEHFLYDVTHNLNLNIKTINRYPNLNGAGYRNIDSFGLWHEHDNKKVKDYLNV